MPFSRCAALLLAIPLALALAAPAPALAAPPADDFKPSGEVHYRGSAAFDATHVRGPKVNMALTKDGKWGGSLLGKDVHLKVTDGKITGAGVNLVVTRKPDSLSVEGLVSGVRVRITATKDAFKGRVGDGQVECVRRPDGYWTLAGGPSSVSPLRFQGTADALPDVPMPQWVFAVIGAL